MSARSAVRDGEKVAHLADRHPCAREPRHLELARGERREVSELYAYNEEADLATYAQTMHEVADDMDAILDGSAQDFEIGDDGYRYHSSPNDVLIITEDVGFA